MKLRAINKNTEKYGYPQIMEYDNITFNGHQLGVAICLQNSITKEIEKNYLSESLGDEQTRDFLLGELLHEENAVLITENVTLFDEQKQELVSSTIFYMPYYVEEHSRFKPTVIGDNIGRACNVSYDVQVEVLFVQESFCRYATLNFKTRNLSVIDNVYGFFDEDYTLDNELKEIGITWQEDTEDEDQGYVLDFYNRTGQKCNCLFHDLEELRDAIVSIRLIGIQHHIDKVGEDNGNELG